MFLNLVLYRASLPVNMIMTALVHFHLCLEQELFPFDIIPGIVVYVGEQIAGIGLLSFFGHQCQM